MRLYHTGYQIIEKPDVHYGRKNADFGQGFYLTGEEEFACRWARERKGSGTFLNTYELNTEGLRIRRLARNEEWFEYIFRNREGLEDLLSEEDVIIGPIANDTIYNTFGVFTSGVFPEKIVMELLMIGPEYTQIVLKTEKAASQLAFVSARELEKEEIAAFRKITAEEERAYQEQLSRRIGEKDAG